MNILASAIVFLFCTQLMFTQIEDKRQQRWFIFGVAFASLMVNIDTYSVNVSLPDIAAHFRASSAETSWAVLAYNLAVTGGLLVAGRIGDRLGLRRVFLFGFGLYALSSLACGLAPTLAWLIVARAVQGMGGAILFGLSPAMVPRFLPHNVRGSAFGALAMAAAFGMTIGAPLGGLISGLISWRGIFLVNVIVGSLALSIGRRILPCDAGAGTETRPQGLDVPGGILSAGAALAVAFGLTEAPRWGWTAPAVLVSLIGGSLAFVAFILRERNTRDPLLDLRLFRDPSFVKGNVTSFLMYLFLAGTNFVMPFYLAHIKGLTSAQTGFAMLAYALAFLVTGFLAGKAADRWNTRIIETGALALTSIAAAGFTLAMGLPGLMPALAFLTCFGVGLAAFSPANNKTVMNMAPVGQEGMVAGAYRMIMRMGLVFGVCGSSLALTLACPAGIEMEASKNLAGFQMAYGVGALLLFGAMLCAWHKHATQPTSTSNTKLDSIRHSTKNKGGST